MSTSVRLETNENTTGKYQAADKECEECSGNSWAALSLPDILAARAGDRLRRMLPFQGFLTNRTVFLPHIHTWLSLTIGLKQGEIGADQSGRCCQISGLAVRRRPWGLRRPAEWPAGTVCADLVPLGELRIESRERR